MAKKTTKKKATARPKNAAAKKTTRKKKSTPARTDSIRHKDSRVNIPTEELRDFVKHDEHAPKAKLYPRDPSLDPQLVWQGKDEQDREDLAVPVVPIYIQEKIHPQAIIDDFRAHADKEKAKQPGEQPSLYADFNDLPEDFSDRIDFYSQKDENQTHWSNRMILGDSLMVMTSLAEKEGLKGKVQTIYLDPPYGIKFGSNWQVSTRKRDVKDGKHDHATRQPEQVRAFRDTWKLGIHSYLAYLRDRFVVARDLLTETGSIFVQIGDENVHLVRCVMDEVFGSENFCSQITVSKTSGANSPTAKTNILADTSDFLLWYARSKEQVKYRRLFTEKGIGSDDSGVYSWIEELPGERRKMSPDERNNPKLLPKDARPFRLSDLTSQTGGESIRYEYSFADGVFNPPGNRGWSTTRPGMDRLAAATRLMVAGATFGYVRYWNDFPVSPFGNMWGDTATGSFTDPKVYVVQTGTKTVQRCLLMTTDPGDLVLDPTCGSGTTAYVAEQWGRRWITIDTSRVALALARTRLMAARFPYYYLADDYPDLPTTGMTDKEIKKYLRNTPPASRPNDRTAHNVRRGFVYKRVPHVTLKSIANNPDIKEGMSREEIDAAIARHADTETLYDQPYADTKVVRVTGPFTVESLSPHRTISVEEKKDLAEKPNDLGYTVTMMAGDSFTNTILDNLRRAGVENTKKGERLKFNSLDILANPWLHAGGTFTEADGTEKRVAVCIGPEHGTVGAQLIKEAAKEAVKGVGFDVLLVCGFAFDPSVTEEAKRYGDLVVLPTKMNSDLAMGEELLKKTGAGNLFMVFGEPDIDIAKAKDGKLTVEIKGLDVYDPTTGAIRSSSTDDIACWFIDTKYNGESFFVRHAYFTGADEPYKRLKAALRAEIDEDAWDALYSTVSRPFSIPETGKIAVKVINHYGDEVMQVFDVG